MKSQRGKLGLSLFFSVLAACAANDQADESSEGPIGEERAPVAESEAPSPAPTESEAPEAEPEPPASEEPQARIFGAGTSCTSNSCLNGGTCLEQWLGYSCWCPSGFTGAQCQTASTASGSCGALTLSNGSVNLSNGTSYGSVARYVCSTGYVLNGTSTRTCQSTGWSGSAPTCSATSCGALAAPANGSVNLSNGTSYGSVARYVCSAGYVLNGTSTRTCQSTGWSGSAPSCLRWF